MNSNARRNVITAMSKVKPSHLLDENLREACGLDRMTGSVVDETRAQLIGEKKVSSSDVGKNGEALAEGIVSENGVEMHSPSSFIESLL